MRHVHFDELAGQPVPGEIIHMYSDAPKMKSAKSFWDHANPSIRLQMMRASGCTTLAQAYRKFDDLPLMVKVDLNTLLNPHDQEVSL